MTYQTLCPTGTFSNRGKTTYALHLVAAQDWSATGLAKFLWDNDGASAEVQYQAHGATAIPPTTSTRPAWPGRWCSSRRAYGGEADTYAELEVTMPFTSKPSVLTGAFPRVEESAAEEETAEAIEAA